MDGLTVRGPFDVLFMDLGKDTDIPCTAIKMEKGFLLNQTNLLSDNSGGEACDDANEQGSDQKVHGVAALCFAVTYIDCLLLSSVVY